MSKLFISIVFFILGIIIFLILNNTQTFSISVQSDGLCTNFATEDLCPKNRCLWTDAGTSSARCISAPHSIGYCPSLEEMTNQVSRCSNGYDYSSLGIHIDNVNTSQDKYNLKELPTFKSVRSMFYSKEWDRPVALLVKEIHQDADQLKIKDPVEYSRVSAYILDNGCPRVEAYPTTFSDFIKKTNDAIKIIIDKIQHSFDLSAESLKTKCFKLFGRKNVTIQDMNDILIGVDIKDIFKPLIEVHNSIRFYEDMAFDVNDPRDTCKIRMNYNRYYEQRKTDHLFIYNKKIDEKSSISLVQGELIYHFPDFQNSMLIDINTILIKELCGKVTANHNIVPTIDSCRVDIVKTLDNIERSVLIENSKKNGIYFQSDFQNDDKTCKKYCDLDPECIRYDFIEKDSKGITQPAQCHLHGPNISADKYNSNHKERKWKNLQFYQLTEKEQMRAEYNAHDTQQKNSLLNDALQGTCSTDKVTGRCEPDRDILECMIDKEECLKHIDDNIGGDQKSLYVYDDVSKLCYCRQNDDNCQSRSVMSSDSLRLGQIPPSQTCIIRSTNGGTALNLGCYNDPVRMEKIKAEGNPPNPYMCHIKDYKVGNQYTGLSTGTCDLDANQKTKAQVETYGCIIYCWVFAIRSAASGKLKTCILGIRRLAKALVTEADADAAGADAVATTIEIPVVGELSTIIAGLGLSVELTYDAIQVAKILYACGAEAAIFTPIVLCIHHKFLTVDTLLQACTDVESAIANNDEDIKSLIEGSKDGKTTSQELVSGVMNMKMKPDYYNRNGIVY